MRFGAAAKHCDLLVIGAIFKTHASVCVCALFVGNPRGWRTAAKVPRGAGAHPGRVRAAALQACVHAGLQPAGAHTALAVAHLPDRVPQHPWGLPQRPPRSGKRAHTHTNTKDC